MYHLIVNFFGLIQLLEKQNLSFLCLIFFIEHIRDRFFVFLIVELSQKSLRLNDT